MKILLDGRVVEGKELELLLKTTEGRMRVQVIIKSMITAFAMDNVHSYLLTEIRALKKPLTYEEMQDVCNIVWSCFFQRQEGELDKYIDECVQRIEKEGWQSKETVH